MKRVIEAAKRVVTQPGYLLVCPGDDDGNPCQQCRERAELAAAVAAYEKQHPLSEPEVRGA